MFNINQHTTTLSKALLTAGLLGGAALSSLGAGIAKATPQNPGLISFQVGCDCSNPLYSGTVGWDFQVNSVQSISYLGVYDANADGLVVATDVGLWNRDTNTLLRSTTVPQGIAGELLGQFRYVPISTLILQPGVNYALGAQYNQPYNSDWYQLITTNNSFAPWLNYLNPTEIGGSSLTLPNNLGQSPFGIYGPNIAQVPAPLPLLGAGAAFGSIRKLRKFSTQLKTFSLN
jgi:hypothetical protein